MDSASSISSWVLAIVRYQAELSYMIINLTKESPLAARRFAISRNTCPDYLPGQRVGKLGLRGPLIVVGGAIRGR